MGHRVQTGQIVSVTPSPAYDAFATKTSGVAKILVGGGGTTGNIAVNLRKLDTTSGIMQDNKVRVVVQRIPDNGGGAVQGPVTIGNSVVTAGGAPVVRHEYVRQCAARSRLGHLRQAVGKCYQVVRPAPNG